MTKKKPDPILGKSFRDVPIVWNGIHFHKFSLETQLIVMDAELTFLYEPAIKLSVPEKIRQMTEFLYIHGTDPDMVAFKSDDPEAWKEKIRVFARQIPVTGLIGLREVVEKIVAGIAEATVDVQEKPGGGSSRETPPPN